MNKRMAWAGVCLLTLLITAGCEQSARAKTAKGSAPTAGLPGDAAGNSAGAPTVATAALALPGIENVMTGIYERVSKSVVNIQVRKAAPAEGQGGPGGLRGFGGRGHGFDPFGFPPGDGDDEQGQGPGPGPQQKGRKHYQQGSGSGFVWDTDGHIVSNNHVVGGADKLTVTFSDGTQVPGKLVGADPDSDLAVIKVDLPKDRLQTVQMGDSRQVKVGQLSIAIGNPFGLQGTMTVGFISALGRLLPVSTTQQGPGYTIPDVIQTDAPINPGNSGGVLTNSGGQVVGVTSAIISPAGASAGIGFAIPSAIVMKVVPALISKGRFDHAWLGISGESLSPELAKAMGLDQRQRGALVVDVLSGSPADKAGVKGSDKQIDVDGDTRKVGGDVVTKIGDQPVKAFDEIVAYLARSAEVGQVVPLTLLRGGKEMVVKVTLLARPGQKQTAVKQASAKGGSGGWLGIAGGTLEPALAKAMNLPPTTKGVLVGEVESGSPADKAGLRGSTKVAEIDGEQVQIGGDVVTAAKGQALESIDQLQELLQNSSAGDKLELKLLRDGKPTTLTVTLGKPTRQ